MNTYSFCSWHGIKVESIQDQRCYRFGEPRGSPRGSCTRYARQTEEQAEPEIRVKGEQKEPQCQLPCAHHKAETENLMTNRTRTYNIGCGCSHVFQL